MRIVFFTDTYWPRVNGVTVSIQTFADALKKRGHDVLIVCPEYPKDKQDPDPRHEYGLIRVPSVGSFFSKEDRVSNPLAIREIEPQIAQFDPDIIHTQTEFSFGSMGKRYAKKRGYPVIATCHTHWERYIEYYIPGIPSRLTRAIARAIMRSAYRGADVIIVPSAQIGEVLTAYGIRKEFHLIPTGIDADFFKADAVRDERVKAYLTARWPRLAKGPVLLFVGRVGQEKNVAFLFEVMPRIQARYPDATLLLVGDGPYKTVLQKHAESLGLADSCLFAGYLPREDLPSVYAFADLFAFPSKTETQGLVTIEAMLCGTPVVAIGEMGTADVMGGDNGGYMVKDDVDEFSSRILELLGNPELMAAKSADARSYAQRWTVDGMTERLLEVYTRVAARRRPRRGGISGALLRFFGLRA